LTFADFGDPDPILSEDLSDRQIRFIQRLLLF